MGGTNAKAFYLRGQQARDDPTDAQAAVAAGTGVRAALVQASYIMPMSAFPDPRVPDTALADQAAAVLAELNRRVAALPPVIDNANDLPTTASADLIANGKQAMEAVFGPEFRALPDVDPPRFTEIEQALDARSTLVDGDDAAPDKYLQRLAHARPRVSKWRKLNIDARVFGKARPRVDVVQLPFVPGEEVVGGRLRHPQHHRPRAGPEPAHGRPHRGVASQLRGQSGSARSPGGPWWSTDWTEVIPNQVEETGIAMHFDSPSRRPRRPCLWRRRRRLLATGRSASCRLAGADHEHDEDSLCFQRVPRHGPDASGSDIPGTKGSASRPRPDPVAGWWVPTSRG